MLKNDKFSEEVISMRSPARRYLCIFLSSVVAIVAAIPGSHAAAQEVSFGSPDRSRVCSNLGQYIFVGGTGGFDALRDGGQFEELLKTGHVGLYEHANAISAAEKSPGDLADIERVFSGTGPGQAELGQVGWNYFTLPPSYAYYQRVYVQNGLNPSEANVNTPSDSAAPGQLEQDVQQWKEYVDAARSVGIESVAPVVAPNAASEPKLGENAFATNPFYALEREEALYGKAIAFDVPPNFFFSGGSGPGYQKFIVQAVQWGNAHGLRTTMLLSPYPWPTNSNGQLETFRQFTGNTFSRDTQNFVRRLLEEHAVPSEWAVDNYEDTYPDDAPTMVPETVLNTTTEVGLWLARNAPVYVRKAEDNDKSVICFPPQPAPAGNVE
ncbi:MAG: hypothetical protein WA197_20855 [Candidatus Acidiferrales bacterium]